VFCSIYDGSTASSAGLKEGDMITRINTKDISALDVHQIRALLPGQQNTKVVMTIQRPGETSPKDYPVVRRPVNAKRE
jgi:carboxyl-terminal processing protease